MGVFLDLFLLRPAAKDYAAYAGEKETGNEV